MTPNGLRATCFQGCQTFLCFHKRYFHSLCALCSLHSSHPCSHFAALALTLSVSKWEDSCNLADSLHLISRTAHNWLVAKACVCVHLWAGWGWGDTRQVIIQYSHCVSGLMRWQLIARSGQQFFWAGLQTVQRRWEPQKRWVEWISTMSLRLLTCPTVLIFFPKLLLWTKTKKPKSQKKKWFPSLHLREDWAVPACDENLRVQKPPLQVWSTLR